MISFTVPCVPPNANHQHKSISTRGGKPRLHDSPQLIAAVNMLTGLFLPHRPKQPLDGPLSLTVTLTYPYTQQQAKKANGAVIPKLSAPDLDNQLKTLTDVLGKCGFFTNDSRICDLRAVKQHGPVPGITIDLREYGG